MSEPITGEQAQELSLLMEAFERFTGAGEAVSRAYRELSLKVEELNIQLDEKNRQLARNLGEKERLSVYLSNILESLGSAVFVLDASAVVEMANRAAGRLLPCGTSTLVGTPFERLFAGIVRPDAAVEELIRSAAEDRDREFEFHPNVGEMRIFRAGCRPMIGSGAGTNGGGRIVILDDVTEEALGRAQAERTGRLAAMGEMAVKIVHEVRNPMGSIELVASLLARDLADEPEKRLMVDRIRSGIRSMDHIISNLLAFARNTQPTRKPLDLPGLLDECLGYNAYLFSAQHIVLSKDYDPNLPPIPGDRELLKQVFMNLFLNAAQAMPKGGELLVTAHAKELRDFDAGGMRAHAQVRVRDTGAGMPPDVRTRVFHPFFTTKERGAGLGLALSHNIVKAHNGAIGVESVPDEGSVFTINLPL